MYGSAGSVTLGELIDRLKHESPNKVIAHGFGGPTSYRGFYEDVAFIPAENVSVSVMLKMAESALGKTFKGYKGGDFTMTKNTDVWIAEWGMLGEALTPRALDCMLNHG